MNKMRIRLIHKHIIEGVLPRQTGKLSDVRTTDKCFSPGIHATGGDAGDLSASVYTADVTDAQACDNSKIHHSFVNQRFGNPSL